MILAPFYAGADTPPSLKLRKTRLKLPRCKRPTSAVNHLIDRGWGTNLAPSGTVACCLLFPPAEIGKVYRIPLVRSKCVSENQKADMTALLRRATQPRPFAPPSPPSKSGYTRFQAQVLKGLEARSRPPHSVPSTRSSAKRPNTSWFAPPAPPFGAERLKREWDLPV